MQHPRQSRSLHRLAAVKDMRPGAATQAMIWQERNGFLGQLIGITVDCWNMLLEALF